MAEKRASHAAQSTASVGGASGRLAGLNWAGKKDLPTFVNGRSSSVIRNSLEDV
jgi:hypothetical protein